MLFGQKDRFGIEIGEVELLQGALYCQFRFWICGTPIGDWEDRIPLQASIEHMRVFCSHSANRGGVYFGGRPADHVFEEVYHAFYTADYTKCPVEVPNLRDRFHLDEIGMSAVLDKYGLVLVASSPAETRLIVENLVMNAILCDCPLRFGEVEEVGLAYLAWGKEALAAPGVTAEPPPDPQCSAPAATPFTSLLPAPSATAPKS